MHLPMLVTHTEFMHAKIQAIVHLIKGNPLDF